MSRREIFPETAARLEEWVANPQVLGVLLVGSKSADYVDDMSDDDLEVILTDEAHARLGPIECSEVLYEGEASGRKIIYDAYYEPITELEHKASSSRDLDHWPYEHARVLFDRDLRVGRAVEAAGRMDGEFRQERLLHGTVDAWVAARRAAKTFGRGAEGAGRLIVARGAKALARVIFALEWRWVPLDHWLEPELRTLEDSARAGARLLEAVTTGRPEPIAEALDRLEDRLQQEGVARPADRVNLFLELIHPSRAEERLIHGLY